MRPALVLAVCAAAMVALALVFIGGDSADSDPASAGRVAQEVDDPIADTSALEQPEGTPAEPFVHREAAGPRTSAASSDPAPVQEVAPETASEDEAALLEVRLLRPDGRPATGRARVDLVEAGADGAPRNGGRRSRFGAGRAGEFTLRIPEWAFRSPLLVVGREPGLLPATHALHVVRRLENDPIDLVLGDGAVLSGRVTLGGAPVPDHDVHVDLRYGTPGVFGLGQEGFWFDGAFVEKTATVRTDRDGRFRFTGLVDDRYDLRTAYVHPLAVPGSYARRVTVADGEIGIELERAEIEVVVACDGGPPPEGMQVTARSEDGTRAGQVEDGRVAFAVGTGAEVEFHAKLAGYDAEGVRAAAGGLGSTVQAHLDLWTVARPSLRVRVSNAPERLTAVHVDVGRAHLGTGLGPVPRIQGLRAERESPGLFANDCLDLEPGRYVFTLRDAELLREETVEAEVPHAGSVELEFEGLPGGAYDVRIDGAQDLTWRVEHTLGNVIEARQRSTFVSTDENGQEMAFSSEFATVSRRSAVAAGSYRLVVEVDGREPVTKEFEVRAGETTSVSIDLGEG
ncbi:MAG: hypothetical protein AAFU73_03985 [Planctomycetota bacterium]